MSTLLPLLALLILFIGLPWLVLHYVTKMQQANRMTPADEKTMEEIWRSARHMQRRIETLEEILELKKDKKDQDQ